MITTPELNLKTFISNVLADPNDYHRQLLTLPQTDRPYALRRLLNEVSASLTRTLEASPESKRVEELKILRRRIQIDLTAPPS